MVERSAKPSAIPISPSGPAPQVFLSDDNSRVIAQLPQGDRVEVLLCGATVISWKTANGREQLFLSDKAVLDGSKAVRGGVPIVFPLFGPPTSAHAPTAKLPQHGFARSARWEYLGKSSSESGPLPGSNSGDAAVKLDFGLSSGMLDDKTKAAWPHTFGLTYSVTLSAGELGLSLQANNSGAEAWEFQALLHTYFAVEDIQKVQITGLEDHAYADKTRLQSTDPPTPTAVSATGQPITIAGETDRVYSAPQPDTPAPEGGDKALPPLKPIAIADGGGQPRFEVRRDGLRDCVVWNPWSDKAGTMADFGPADGWKRMVCVEAGAVKGWTKVEAGEAWEGGFAVKAV